MQTKTWSYEDKSAWGDGPWQTEPDKVQWSDKATGLPCIIRRSPMMGNWCGYVGVFAGHPFFGLDYNDIPVEVHGGLTFADRCDPSEDETGVCHFPEPGEPDNVWWFGFDCGHAFDFSPGMRAHQRAYLPPELLGLLEQLTEAYRDLDYVKAEVESLARQLKAVQTAQS